MIPKFNYKIYDKKNKTFFSANRKSTWTNKNAVIDFVKKRSRTIDDIEVYIYPVENAIVKTASDFLNDNQADIDAKEAKKLEREKKHELAMKQYRLKQLESQLEETKKEIDELKR
jgi:gamma-glutamyl phosphate reductase